MALLVGQQPGAFVEQRLVVAGQHHVAHGERGGSRHREPVTVAEQQALVELADVLVDGPDGVMQLLKQIVADVAAADDEG